MRLGQSAGSSKIAMRNRKAIFTIWFVRSDCPSVCGWYAVKYSRLTPSLKKRLRQSSNKNLRFRSEMITLKSSQSAMSSLCNRASAHFIADHVIFPDTIVTRFENLSVTDFMQSRPVRDLSRANTKSRVRM